MLILLPQAMAMPAPGYPGAAPADIVQREWWWLNGDQKKPVDVRQWQPYDPPVQYHLSASYAAMQMEARREGLVLDLGTFSDPPSPYQVWRANPLEVVNTRETEMVGHLSIAAYPKDLWELPLHQLPPSAKHGKIVAGFYQIRRDHVDGLQELNRYLADPRSPTSPFAEPGAVRRRVCILIEIERPKFLFGDVDRFRKKRTPAAPEALPAAATVHDEVPPGEAVFQWWWGDPINGVGHWKNYHPHVSAKLEKYLSTNDSFRTCQESVAIDEVRYRMQRISREKNFDYLDQMLAGGFREPFMPEHVVTIDHFLFDDMTRMTQNCFVQFQNGNPKRRRPVRRIRRGDAAGIEMPEGEPCGICFSDTGVLTGCDQGHVVCHSCLRMGLRILIGDISKTEGLVCGCLTMRDTVALEGLADKGDATTQDTIARPPAGDNEKAEFDMELAQVRRAFQLADRIPADTYRRKLREWFDKLKAKEAEHLYHACVHPGCGMENWIMRSDFDCDYRARGLYTWTCKRGHKNSVLPSQDEINDMNKNILLHPEHYDDRCAHDTMALRRFRLCPQCVDQGQLTFAVHESGCKQWPGGGIGGGHRHCFCFHCTRVWGGSGCSHALRCDDPGIQQVRRIASAEGEVLEIGFIDAKQYIDWVQARRSICPPTVFRRGEVLGATRQGMLGMEDRAVLKRTISEGTR